MLNLRFQKEPQRTAARAYPPQPSVPTRLDRSDDHRHQLLARQIALCEPLHLGGCDAADALDVLADDAVRPAAEDVFDRDVRHAERTVEDAHHFARHDVLDQLQLLVGDRLLAQPLDLGVDLRERRLGDLRADLGPDGEVAFALEVDHRGHHAVGVAVPFAQILHQPRAEVAAQRRRHDLHPQKIGMFARKEEPPDADRRLDRPRMRDSPLAGLAGFREGNPCGQFGGGQLFEQGDDRRPFRLADAAAADGEAVRGGVAPPVEVAQILAAEPVVGAFVEAFAVGVTLAEDRLGEGLAGADIDLRAVDPQPLPAFGAVGRHRLLGKGGAQQNFGCHVERRHDELREHREVDVGVVAVGVDIEVGTVVVEPFGYFVGAHPLAPFGEQVGRRRSREGNPLRGRTGMKDDRKTQNFEIVAR